MAQILLGLGSNVAREHHLRAGINALKKLDAQLILSPVYQSAAVGFDGDDFYNCVVCLNADIDLAGLVLWVATIEQQYGRLKNEPRFSAKTLDIDILTFDQLVGVFDAVTLPREEILHSAFVLKPLFDLCPQASHPVMKQTYEALWLEFDVNSPQVLTQVFI